MSPNDKKFSFPSAPQVLLATAVGVGIGLLAMGQLKNFYSHTPLSGKANLSQTLPAAAPTKCENKAKGLADFSLWPKLASRMNVLLMGVDSNGRDTERFTGCRSDTMIIASLDPESKKVSLVSIPRDSRVRIADNHGVDKINSAHAFGGPELAVKTVGEDFGVPIDHYIVIDTQGLKKVFEALGPVEILIEKPMHYRDRAGRLNIALEPGLNKLDAAGLEEYVRYRHDAKGDIGRIERQQWFLRQVKKKLEEPQVLLKLPELCKLAGEYVRTDLSVEDMLKLAAFSKEIKTNKIQTAMLPGDPVTISGGSYWVPQPEASALMLHRMTGAPQSVSVIAANTGATIHSKRHSRSDEALAMDGSSETALSDSIATNDNLAAQCAAAYSDKPVSIILRYAKGSEETAKNLEARLKEKGYYVKYQQRGELSECQHEQVIASSYRADDELVAKLKDSIAELDNYAVVVHLESRAPSDITIVVCPTTAITAPIVVTATDAKSDAKGNEKGEDPAKTAAAEPVKLKTHN
ncbi:LCP family protein [bacterium]|nr:LCP family protein [bacterium]MBP9807600.1 LCP family protein [bacterium]